MLILAGLFQWTPFKDGLPSRSARRRSCSSSAMAAFAASRRDSLWLGRRHGLYCVGCCWALMALLFIGGVMNVLWIAALSGFVLIEKMRRRGASRRSLPERR